MPVWLKRTVGRGSASTKTIYGVRGMNYKDAVIKRLKENALLVFMVVLCLVIAALKPVFFSPRNLMNILIQISISALVATGMTFVILSGGIDLSVGSTAAFSGIVLTALLSNRGDVAFIWILLLIIAVSSLIALVFGGFIGSAVTRLRMEPFVATLSMMSIARGFAYLYTKSRPIYGLPPAYGIIGTQRIGSVPIIVLLMIATLVTAHIVLTRTVFGRHVYAVGSNSEVAELSGVNVNKVKMAVYMISAFCASLAGICLSSRLMMGQPGAAVGYELDAIAAVAMGGTSLTGGSGGVNKTIKGVIIIGIIHNGLSLLQVDSYWQTVATGLIIFFAVAFERANALKHAA